MSEKDSTVAYAACGIGNIISDDNWETLVKEHKIFSSLLKYFSMSKASPDFMPAFPMCASSTDQYPPFTIINTLNLTYCSYWSSKGESDPNASECLLYRLNSRSCLGDWEPVTSPIAVRFHMGHSQSIADVGIDICMTRELFHDKYVLKYTSPQFPMAQIPGLQIFKLPEPVVCVGGVVHIELIGRAKKEDKHGLFYIRLCHVKFMGRNLEPDFYAEMFPSGELQLTYNCQCPKHYVATTELEPENDMEQSVHEGMFDFLDEVPENVMIPPGVWEGLFDFLDEVPENDMVPLGVWLFDFFDEGL